MALQRKSMISLELFQAFVNRSSIISIIITSSFLVGCSGSSENQTIEMITIPRIPATFVDPPASNDDIKNTDYSSQFDQLKNKNTILKSTKIGRNDPFQLPEDDNYSLEIPSGMSFNGIIKANGLVKAIITNEETSGSIMEGETGSSDNTLIPKGWLVKNIDEENGEVVLTYKDQSLILSLQKF